jgi:hypothetical protein
MLGENHSSLRQQCAAREAGRTSNNGMNERPLIIYESGPARGARSSIRV